MDNFEVCKVCKRELSPTKNPRLKPIACVDRKITSRNYQLHKLHLECASNSQEEDAVFEDVEYDEESGVMHKSKPSTAIGVRSSLG